MNEGELLNRIRELEDALKPFADAAEDEDVKAYSDHTCLLCEDERFGHHFVMHTRNQSALLRVEDLRAAAEALKGSTP